MNINTLVNNGIQQHSVPTTEEATILLAMGGASTKPLQIRLQTDGFRTAIVNQLEDLQHVVSVCKPRLVVLDARIKPYDYLSVCQALRGRYANLLILVLLPTREMTPLFRALDCGADDCLALPLSDSEIIVRIRIMLQNYQRQSQARRKYPHVEILTEERRVIINGTSLHLTMIEFDLLAVLTNRPGIVVSRRSLAQLVWGEDWVGDERLVDSHMCRLRKKIQAAGLHTSLLLCVRGVGYVFRPDEETPATV